MSPPGTPDDEHEGHDELDRHRRRVLWALPTGLYLVGSRHGDEVNLMTANLVVQVCLEPKLVGVALEHESVTARLVTAGDGFTLSLLARTDRDVVRRFVKPVTDIERDPDGAVLALSGLPVTEVGSDRRPILTADHVMASACLPRLFQAVELDGAPYWDGGFAGNPPLWPLIYETDCLDAIIVQINPIERRQTPRTSREIVDRTNEITFNSALLAELRAVKFVIKLLDEGALDPDRYKRMRVHRIGGDGRLEAFGAATKVDTSWPFLKTLRDLGRQSAQEWLAVNFAAIGERGTLDLDAEVS